MVSVRSLTSRRSSLSKSTTSTARVRRTGSPNRRMGLTDTWLLTGVVPQVYGGDGSSDLGGIEDHPYGLGRLAGAAKRGGSLEGDRELSTVLTGDADERPLAGLASLAPLVEVERSEHLTSLGQLRMSQQVRQRVAGSGDRGHPHGGREPKRRPVGQLTPGVPGRVPPYERLHRGQRGVGHDHDL